MHRCVLQLSVTDVTWEQNLWDFPGGPVVETPPTNAGDAGSIPGQETKISHAMGQVSPFCATAEPVCSMICVPWQGPQAITTTPGNQKKKKKRKRKAGSLHLPRPSGSESAVEQDPRVIFTHIKV